MTSPRPSAQFDHYKNNENYVHQFLTKGHKFLGFARELLSTLEGIITPVGSSLLDVGCGGAFVVETAKEKGFIAQGIEANSALVKFAKNRGLDVENDDICKIKNRKYFYNVIVLSSVLEHVENPINLLMDCKELLAKNGVILISQASYDGLLPRLFPWGWYGWQPQEHYWHFTSKSFSMLVNNSGFNVIKIKRKSLHHPWFSSGPLKILVGRNLAAVLARIGNLIGMPDSFDIIIAPNSH